MQYRYYSGASRRRQIPPHPRNCDAGRVITQSPSHGGSRWGRPGIKNYPPLMFAFRSWRSRGQAKGESVSCACKLNNPKEGWTERIRELPPSPQGVPRPARNVSFSNELYADDKYGRKLE
ncbi:hypothetical protein ElyMa_000507100 [Elysia marginata]|uniref:Uncharacterized protein n=1 Tax=Elysia marginata TaxID=1093978 RepID=A0AAV4FVV8_9GAST|nr:hypothetical protein ElyMa_000507100 [Elysia marginata]